ncbi:MAG: methyltransferase family protein [Candidatus Helarchaeota archaeon]
MASSGTLFLWAFRTLSLNTTLSLEGRLITNVPYKYTRNHQYMGDISLFIGYALITDSLFALITITFLAFCFILMPFTEEPWLKEKYGDQYLEYCKKVPRFIKILSLKI